MLSVAASAPASTKAAPSDNLPCRYRQANYWRLTGSNSAADFWPTSSSDLWRQRSGTWQRSSPGNPEALCSLRRLAAPLASGAAVEDRPGPLDATLPACHRGQQQILTLSAAFDVWWHLWHQELLSKIGQVLSMLWCECAVCRSVQPDVM